MDYEEEENDLSDLEELEFALYSQIHYDSKNCDIATATPNNSNEKALNTPINVTEEYDINVKHFSTDSRSSTPKGSLKGTIPNLNTVQRCRKFNSISTSQEDSAVGLESFLSLETTWNSVNPESDSLECIEEENSKAAEVLSQRKQSKLPGTNSKTNKSVIEIESDSEDSVILLSDCDDSFDSDVENVSVNSDDMVLDEELSDVDGLHVNVDEDDQAKLTSEYDFAHHQKTWHIIDADRYGTVPHHAKGRYYGSEFDRCHNCKQNGHMAKSCPKPKKVEICILCGFIGHFHRTCQKRACFRCDCPGHLTKDCTERGISKWNPCFRCGMQGHSKKTCPDQWRQYHLTTNGNSFRRGRNQKNPKKYCYNCAEEGHYGYECEDERMDNYSFPSYPFIQSYDFPDAKKSKKRGLNQDSEEGYSKKTKKAKKETPDFVKEGKKKKSKKLKRIYERLETEKKQSKRKKKRFLQSESFLGQSGESEPSGVRTVSRDTEGFHGNIQSLTVTVTQRKDKKNKKLNRIYDRIQTEKQHTNGSFPKNKGKPISKDFNPNWQRMKNNNKGSSAGPFKKVFKNGHGKPSGRDSGTRINVNPVNASKGFKTKMATKK